MTRARDPGMASLAFIAILCIAIVGLWGPQLANAVHVACPISSGSYNAGTNYSTFWNTSSVERPGFSVQVNNAFVLLTDKRANTTVCVYLCNTPVPVNLPGDPRCFEAPIDFVALADPSLAVFMTRLGVQDDVVTVARQEELVDPCLQARVQSSLINDTAAAEAEVVFALSDRSTEGYNASRVVQLSVNAETDPLETFEWIQFLAPFFLANPNPVNEYVVDNYNCTAGQMMVARPKPKVAWLTKLPDGSFRSGEAWQEQLVKDAGLTPYPPYKTTYNSTFLLRTLLTVDILIDSTNTTDTFAAFLAAYGITDGSLTSPYPFIANKMVWRTDRLINDAKMSEWDIEAWARPEEAQLDLIDAAFETYKAGLTKRWLRNVAKSDVQTTVTARNCPDPQNPPERTDATCPDVPFNGEPPVPAWTTTPPEDTGDGETGGNPNTGGEGEGEEDDTTDPGSIETGTPPPLMNSGQIAGIVIGTVAGIALAAAIVLGVLASRGHAVLPRLSPSRKREPETPNTGYSNYSGAAGAYSEMRDDEVVLPAGATTGGNYANLELYSLEGDDNN